MIVLLSRDSLEREGALRELEGWLLLGSTTDRPELPELPELDGALGAKLLEPESREGSPGTYTCVDPLLPREIEREESEPELGAEGLMPRELDPGEGIEGPDRDTGGLERDGPALGREGAEGAAEGLDAPPEGMLEPLVMLPPREPPIPPPPPPTGAEPREAPPRCGKAEESGLQATSAARERAIQVSFVRVMMVSRGSGPRTPV